MGLFQDSPSSVFPELLLMGHEVIDGNSFFFYHDAKEYSVMSTDRCLFTVTCDEIDFKKELLLVLLRVFLQGRQDFRTNLAKRLEESTFKF